MPMCAAEIFPEPVTFTTPRCAALQSAVERAEESLRHVEERSRQAVERARSDFASLRSQLELETQPDSHALPTLTRTWHRGMK